MKYILTTFVVVVIFIGSASLYAQNLVPNPDFSLVSGCPGNWPAPPCPVQFSCIESWWAATPYWPPWEFHKCGSGLRGVPKNGFFYQEPKRGDGFIGISVNGSDSYPHRSMAECSLLEEMQTNVDYYVFFYVSRQEHLWGIQTYYDAIGAFFSDTVYLAKPEYHIPLSVPPPDIWASDVIRDTVGWEKVSGCYKAHGGERYMVLGNMKLFEQLKTEPGAGDGTSVWYYIDDVGVYAFDPLPDTILICSNDTLSLSTEFLDAEIYWQGNVHTNTYEVTEPGVLIVEARIDECILRDTAIVVQFPLGGSINEVALEACLGDTVTLELCMPGNYTWETAGVSPAGVVREPGSYRAIAQTKCGDFICVYNVSMPTCDCPVYIPTGFSPNHDGINEVFAPIIVCEWPIADLQFEIFDRWGNMVHREAGPTLIGWDGSLKYRPLDNGVYSWLLLYNVIAPNRSPKLEKKAGEVHLIR